MPKVKLTDITSKIVDLLEPISSEERQRAVQAAMTLLGEDKVDPKKHGASENQSDDETTNIASIAQKAKAWIKKSGLTQETLEQVFQIDSGHVDVLGIDLPGGNDKTKMQDVYILQGIASFLSSGEPNFDDKTARSLCDTLGCYDRDNHSTYMKGVGNKLTGSKSKGWKLTAPGLAYGAVLIKKIAKVE